MEAPNTRFGPILLLAFSTLLLLPGCDGDSPTAPTLPEGPVQPVVLYESQTSGLTASQRSVIRVEGDFQRTWDEIFAGDPMPEPLPTVDFNVNMVLVVASGEQPNGCYSIAITDASADGTDLTVRVTEVEPTAACMCVMMMVQPVLVVQVPRADEVFFVDTNESSCAA